PDPGAMQCAATAISTAGNCIDDLYYFLALLNSRLLREYVYVLHTAYKWVQPQIEQHVMARLPIPIATIAEKQEIIERAKQLTLACSEAGAVVEWNQTQQHLYEEQERAISALYETALVCHETEDLPCHSERSEESDVSQVDRLMALDSSLRSE
ncbi:MAG: hypothetical protein WCD86_19100, partial [Ktedonobacteraceae bacterium]